MMEQWIVIYRPHNRLNLETEYYGPFDTWGDAFDFMVGLPPLGPYEEPEEGGGNPGFRFITELKPRR